MKDIATQRRPGGPLASPLWFYILDGRPECNGIAAMHYLKSMGFSTEEAGRYLRELQGPLETVPMAATEERHFEL